MILVTLLAASLALLLSDPSSTGVMGGWLTNNCEENSVHNYTFGTPQSGLRTLFKKELEFESIEDKVRTSRLRIPREGGLKEKISYITVFDNSGDRSGGCVSLNGGGVGHNFVNLKFYSQPDEDMDFLIKIYGQPLNPGEKDDGGSNEYSDEDSDGW